MVKDTEWLVKEIHHRVKNNFHIVASLLEIQSSYLKNQDALSAIQEGKVTPTGKTSDSRCK